MNYKHIVFDVDGTLLDTEEAVLLSFQKTLKEREGIEKSCDELKFCLGITGKAALLRMGIEHQEEFLKKWLENMKELSDLIHVFDGIFPLLDQLKRRGISLGVVTSRVRAEYETDCGRAGLAPYFTISVCAEDTDRHKPDGAPLLRYMELAGAKPSEVLYVGDSIYDMECASHAGAFKGLALWGCAGVGHIRADHYLAQPMEVLHLLDREEAVFQGKHWVDWAMELQFIAQAGLTYSKDCFDRERFSRIREISGEIMANYTGMDREKVTSLFCSEAGFQTPKIDTRAAVFQNGQILLVRELDGRWSLPGGWVDVNQSVAANAVKEVKEEAGLDVAVIRLIAVEDRNRHNIPPYAYGICKMFFLCQVIDGVFAENIETDASGYFGLEELPVLSEDKTTREQIEMCFAAYNNKNWITLFE